MADRQEFQQERGRLLRDPAAGDHTQIDTAESVQADGEAYPNPTGAEENDEVTAATEAVRQLAEQADVEVTATLVDEGIAVTFLIPHGLIGVAVSE